jgi:hypothetical protein
MVAQRFLRRYEDTSYRMILFTMSESRSLAHVRFSRRNRSVQTISSGFAFCFSSISSLHSQGLLSKSPPSRVLVPSHMKPFPFWVLPSFVVLFMMAVLPRCPFSSLTSTLLSGRCLQQVLSTNSSNFLVPRFLV